VKDTGRSAATRAWRRCQRRFDANFASLAYLIETVVCYPSSRDAALNFFVSMIESQSSCADAGTEGSLRSGVATRPIAMGC
jgi:hypothetical protein